MKMCSLKFKPPVQLVPLPATAFTSVTGTFLTTSTAFVSTRWSWKQLLENFLRWGAVWPRLPLAATEKIVIGSPPERKFQPPSSNLWRLQRKKKDICSRYVLWTGHLFHHIFSVNSLLGQERWAWMGWNATVCSRQRWLLSSLDVSLKLLNNWDASHSCGSSSARDARTQSSLSWVLLSPECCFLVFLPRPTANKELISSSSPPAGWRCSSGSTAATPKLPMLETYGASLLIIFPNRVS